jgi:pteridine reductase
MKKTALVTGGAKRIGAAIVKTLHNADYDIFLHYGKSKEAAEALRDKLNAIRENSCMIFSADLKNHHQVSTISNWVKNHTDSLDVLVNNASVFTPTPWSNANKDEWQSIFSTNVQTPFFLTQALLELLKVNNGSVINLIDIHADRTLENHPIYCASKSALKSLTLSLAKDHGDVLRCNGVSPGAILWPEDEGEIPSEAQQEILKKIPMQRLGNESNIADTVLFLCTNDYINGQIINVDGGRTTHS